MQLPTYTHIPANSQGDSCYLPILCEYKFLKFQVIISRLGIIHLSFNIETHKKALIRLRLFMPTARLSCSAKDIYYAQNLVKQVLDPTRYKRIIPDFAHNQFLNNGTPFQQKVWQLISQIKTGETITYGKLATTAGSPGGARAAGQACNRNPLALIIPCHRVVAANGPGGFAGDIAIKLKLLEEERRPEDRQEVKLGDIKCLPGNF